MRPFRSILEIPGLRACVQTPPHAAVRQLLRRSGAQNDRQDMCDQWCTPYRHLNLLLANPAVLFRYSEMRRMDQ